MPLSSASRSVRNSLTLAGRPRRGRRRRNRRALLGFEDRLEAVEGAAPERLLPRDILGASQLAVLHRDLALVRALREEADVDVRSSRGPRDAHRLAVARAAHFDRRI